MSKKSIVLKCLGLLIAALSIALSYVITIEGFDARAIHTVGVLIATLALLIFESFNVCITCLLSAALLYINGCVGNITEAFSGYTNHILYFTIASFGISTALQKTGYMQKVIYSLIKRKECSIKGIIAIFMICCAIISAFISNVVAAVVLLPSALEVLKLYDAEEDMKKTKRCLLICMTLSAMIGGLITPAGSSINLICIDMLERYGNLSVRFIDWCIIGTPLVAVMLLVVFFITTKIYKPVELNKEKTANFTFDVKDDSEVSEGKKIFTVTIILLTILAWFLSSWITQINITVVSLICLTLFFMPKFGILSWEEFSEGICWPTFFIAGAMITLASLVNETGMTSYLVSKVFPSEIPNQYFATFLVAAVTFAFMVFVPVAPAAATVLVPLMISFAQQMGCNPVMLAMTASFCVCNCYLFPIDTVMVVAYEQKAFTMFELPRATVWIQLAMIAIAGSWMPFIFNILY